MKYEALVFKLSEYYEKFGRNKFITTFSNIWWALRGPDITDFNDHKDVYTLPIRAAMFGWFEDFFTVYSLCLTLESYLDLVEEVITLKDVNDVIRNAIEHYLDHTLNALAWLEDLFEGTDVGKVFGILANACARELEFIRTGSFRAFRDMAKSLKKITIICQNCIHAEPVEGTNTICCKKDGERHPLHYWCECFEPRLN